MCLNGSPEHRSARALAIFAFQTDPEGHAVGCRAWVCRNSTEEEVVEDRVGPVEPGKWLSWPPQHLPILRNAVPVARSCWLQPHEIPAEWLRRRP
ncbi:EcoRII N-terminal effector-binding domain-containing protein [Novosphingobium sp. CCH12-A3]|uniref:EcoRII N-terminal effector-binding domain-containing protein n=1 Tax=Novosphingobium sp. CCH12-A3 TaxID=1768752 RepID=UPI0009EC1998